MWPYVCLGIVSVKFVVTFQLYNVALRSVAVHRVGSGAKVYGGDVYVLMAKQHNKRFIKTTHDSCDIRRLIPQRERAVLVSFVYFLAAHFYTGVISIPNITIGS